MSSAQLFIASLTFLVVTLALSFAYVSLSQVDSVWICGMRQVAGAGASPSSRGILSKNDGFGGFGRTYGSCHRVPSNTESGVVNLANSYEIECIEIDATK